MKKLKVIEKSSAQSRLFAAFKYISKDIIRLHKRPTVLVIIKSKVAYYHPYPTKRNATATQSRVNIEKRTRKKKTRSA